MLNSKDIRRFCHRDYARPYLNSPNTIDQIIAIGKSIPDPGGIPGALRYDVPGTFRGSNGTWELVVHPETNKIYPFLPQEEISYISTKCNPLCIRYVMSNSFRKLQS